MKQILYDLAPIILIMVGVFATSAFILLRSPLRTLSKFLLVPISLAVSAAVPILFALLLGFSVFLPLPNKFDVLAHRTVIIESEKRFIEIWAKYEGKTRLFKIPYTKEMEQNLRKAQNGREQGLVGRMTRRGDRRFNPYNQELDGGGFDLELLAPQDILPKSPIDGQPQEQSPNSPAFPPDKSEEAIRGSMT